MNKGKRWARILGIAVLAAAMVVLAGCGEKDKFAKAQTEVMQIAKQADALKNQSVMENIKDKEGAKKDLENLAQLKQKHQDMMNQIQEKFKEMDGYVKAEPTLGPTLENLKSQVEDQDKRWNQAIKENEYITSLTLKEYAPPEPDPWLKASKWK